MKRHLGILLLCVVSLCAPVWVRAASEDDAPVEAGIRRALDYLLTQQRTDGSITDTGNPHAMTALALMALGATGHQPTDPDRDGEAMRKALDYLLGENRQRDNGYYGGDGSRMYGHGIVTLALSEMLGMGVNAEQDRRLRQRLNKALELILWAQDRKEKADEEHYGGWRYEPDARDSDLSITIWQLLAMRSAKNAGVEVPKSAIDKAVVYVKRAYKPVEEKRENEKGGACRYQKGRRAEYAAAAAGLLALQACGIYDGTEVDGSVEFLTNLKPNWETRYQFYGTYYYAQGLYQRGGAQADEARKTVNALLLPRQEQNGCWQPHDGEERGAGRVYATSMAVLSLAVYQHFLPIYQR
jgi:hypothetical protein